MYLSLRFSFTLGGEGAAILWSGPEAVAAGATVDGLMEEENRNADGAEGVSEGGLVAKENPEDPEPKGAEAGAAEEESALVTEKTNGDDDDEGARPLAVGATQKGPAEAGRVEAAFPRPRPGNAAGTEAIGAALLDGCTANEPAQRKDYFVSLRRWQIIPLNFFFFHSTAPGKNCSLF